jgi:hypothetical protein
MRSTRKRKFSLALAGVLPGVQRFPVTRQAARVLGQSFHLPKVYTNSANRGGAQ